MKKSDLISAYKRYLRLELNLSENSVNAYLTDVEKLFDYLSVEQIEIEGLEYEHLQAFVAMLFDTGIAPRSIARVISGIKNFFRFLMVEEYIFTDPSELLETPKLGLHLPTILSLDEIDRLLEAIDVTTPEGIRNKAIIEVLYSCGLRVSELCNLKFQNLHLEEGFIQVWGKGRKERLVPISQAAIDALENYLSSEMRVDAKAGQEEFIFLSKRGKAISRIMVFVVVKNLAEEVGIEKEISPHTFRHSFATHLLEGGANLQAIRLMLGHEDIGTTEIYTHIDRKKLREDILNCHPRNRSK